MLKDFTYMHVNLKFVLDYIILKLRLLPTFTGVLWENTILLKLKLLFCKMLRPGLNALIAELFLAADIQA